MIPLTKIKFIAIHHSGNSDSIEKIKNLHIKINKWEDIGYHWLIDKKGNILKARNEKFQGAHVFGHNQNSLAICLLGNLDKNSPTKKQIQALTNFLKEKTNQYKIPIQNILGHREFPNTTNTCPGRFFNMNKLRLKLSNTKS